MGPPIESALSSLSSDVLLRFLARQRWFGAKGATSTSARVHDAVVVPWGFGAFAIARVAVDIGGETRLYQVPLAARDAGPANAPESAVVARGEPAGKWVIVFDAMFDADFVRGFVQAIASGATIAGTGDTRLVFERVSATLDFGRNVATRLGSAEQSNTSLLIGDEAIVKLFRTLNPGIHPDIEVTRFLTTRAGFPNTPALLAAIRFEDGGVATVAGMVQALLPSAVDAWSYALDRGRPYFIAAADREEPNDFIVDAKQLGQVTRALHDALASSDDDADFAPEPALPEDLDRWAHRAQQSVRDALALLERQLTTPAFPRDRVAEAQALVKRREHYVGWINEIADHVGDDLGLRTRTHGDYHLGQVLYSGGKFMIIDFEGEPVRSLAERREKTSPLRDVAGMLRSIAYAAATLAMNESKGVPPHVRELRIARWERDVRAAFLKGYFVEPDDENMLPGDNDHATQLITLFETEKAFYELSYELNNRPGWVWIPMRGIAKLFTQ